MLFTGIILTILIGFSLVNAISFKFSWLEKIGLSFPLGIACQTLLMLLIDWIGIALTSTSVLSSGLVLLILMNIPTWLRRKKIKTELKNISFEWSSVNLVCLLLLALVAWYEYMNFSKCMYFPTFDRDSLTSFDTFGFIIAGEHTLKNLSFFTSDYIPTIHNAGSPISYTPMVQLSYAYVYLLGAETSKIIPALSYLFFLIAFYAVLSRMAGNTGAAIATFFVLLTPEMTSFSSMSITNVIQAGIASTGILYFSLWLRKRENKDLYMGVALLAANLWCRTEGIVFVAAAGVLFLINSIRRKEYKQLGICTIIVLSPMIIWNIFMKSNGFYSENAVISHPFWDPEKLSTIWNGLWALFTNPLYYGWSFAAFALAVVFNSWGTIKNRIGLNLLIMIVLSMLFYILVLYHVDYIWDSIGNVLAYSAKRFMFCFIPLLWAYTVSNSSAIWLTGKLEGFLKLK